MNITGYCEKCRRIKTVRVSSAGMTRIAMRQTPIGVCTACRQDEDDARRVAQLADVEIVRRLHQRTWGPKVRQALEREARRRNLY